MANQEELKLAITDLQTAIADERAEVAEALADVEAEVAQLEQRISELELGQDLSEEVANVRAAIDAVKGIYSDLEPEA